MKSLAGMFVIRDDGEAYRTGKIIEAVGDDTYLVQFDIMNRTADDKWNWPLELVSVMEMFTATNDDDHKVWQFFRTDEERKKYLDWFNNPSKPASIVSIVKKPLEK